MNSQHPSESVATGCPRRNARACGIVLTLTGVPTEPCYLTEQSLVRHD